MQPQSNTDAMQAHAEHITPAAERVVALQGVSNFRDMGGYETEDQRTVKWGKLFRSADLSRATAEDIEKIASLQLAWICDLRTLGERTSNVTPVFAAEVNEHLSFLDSADPNAMLKSQQALSEELLVELNRQMAHRIEVIRSFVKRWLSLEGKPFLFHCMAGKDRTGFIGAFILRALGVPLEQIKQDYALTNVYLNTKGLLQANDSQLEMMKQMSPAIIQALMEAREAYIAAAMDEIDQRFGGFELYWQQTLGFTEVELQQLRTWYVE
ncbi:protein-tyrosine-phosphatase [Paenibacillus montaniterrae]|uniref:Protein-tyrosine-phosphatase n=1 Tax=Paenibacillus montaniterrae TaxID=429341 RepID=A0A919YX44_9BACL|nr:tyrosine-protein phosphatase [Paenibacillus montaniterrae]GIP18836.1 protein-tyrosine-phosphatase [Paenibacillus montaniterrae]